MVGTTTMTQKGQVTIPNPIRKALHVDRDSRFLVSLDETGTQIILKPLADLLSLAGSLKSNIILTDEELQKAREVSWGSRWKN